MIEIWPRRTFIARLQERSIRGTRIPSQYSIFHVEEAEAKCRTTVQCDTSGGIVTIRNIAIQPEELELITRIAGPFLAIYLIVNVIYRLIRLSPINHLRKIIIIHWIRVKKINYVYRTVVYHKLK